MPELANTSINVSINTAPIEAIIAELQSARIWTGRQLQAMLHDAWAYGYSRGHEDGKKGKDADNESENPHRFVEGQSPWGT